MNTLTVLDTCIQKFTQARTSIADAIQSLWEVKQTVAWKSRFTSWTEFCEDGLKINHSTASQYLSVYEHYIEKGKLTVNRLREADMAKLYKALQTKGTPEEQYSRALTLSRAELRDAANEEAGHEHKPETITVCAVCGKRLYEKEWEVGLSTGGRRKPPSKYIR